MDGNNLRSGRPPGIGASDEALYDRFRRTGDRESFGALFDRYADRLSLFIYSIVRQKEDAEELMLDTFAVVAALKSVYRGESGFGTWLFAMIALAFTRGASRRFTVSVLAGMGVCLLAAYISAFINALTGVGEAQTKVFISPAVEEIMKLLPLLTAGLLYAAFHRFHIMD